MDLQSRVAADMKRRANLLPLEIADWSNKARKNIDGMGIHRSQFVALKTMMDTLLARQQTKLNNLSPQQPMQAFSDTLSTLLGDIIGTNTLWSFFRAILNQRKDPTFGALLTVADLTAANCYLTCMDKAVEWGLCAENEHREPPLVFLISSTSPDIFGRGKKLENVDEDLIFGSQTLPISLARVPFDQVSCIWLLCALHHEVGHNLDQELNLRKELLKHLELQLPQVGSQAQPATPAERIGVWKGWAGEILADAFGVLLAGAAFGYTMAPRFPNFRPGKPHPDSYIRVVLVAELLRACDVPQLTSAADFIIDHWYNQQERPAWITPYVENDCSRVAQVFLNTPLAALTDQNGLAHPLRDLVSNLAGDMQKTEQLATFLSTGFNRPDPAKPTHFPFRLVPAAAQLAYMAIDTTNAAALEELQDRALEYFTAIPRPEFLAAPVDRRAHIRKLAEQLDFSAIDVEEER
jgi:hypothetical protein